MLKNLIDVKAAAKHFKVKPLTVAEWIRSNKIPARKKGRRWWIRKEDVEIFENHGNSMPKGTVIENDKSGQIDLFDPEESAGTMPLESLRSPNTFAYMEGKNGWKPLHIVNFPNEFKGRVINILENAEIYGRNYENFMRAAAYNLILDEEQRIKEVDPDSMSAEWEAWDNSQAVIQKDYMNRKVLTQMKEAVRILTKNRVQKAWEEYLEEVSHLVERFEEPWKSEAYEIIASYGKDDKEEELG